MSIYRSFTYSKIFKDIQRKFSLSTSEWRTDESTCTLKTCVKHHVSCVFELESWPLSTFRFWSVAPIQRCLDLDSIGSVWTCCLFDLLLVHIHLVVQPCDIEELHISRKGFIRLPCAQCDVLRCAGASWTTFARWIFLCSNYQIFVAT